jgi:hypothetical protein
MTNIRNIFDIVNLQTGAQMSLPGYGADYRARLDNWQQHAGVRRWNSGYLEGDGILPFSSDLVHIAKHSLVCDRGEATRHHLLAQHLYRFCHFTEHLELEAVVPACVKLRFANTPFLVPRLLSRDAGRVAVDETWHAECADDLQTNIQSAVGVKPCRTRTPLFQNILRVVKAALPEGHDVLADLTFSCVSETLITGSLNKVPHDTAVLPLVREVLREHAREEAYHHGIFAQVIGVKWEQLTIAQRDVVSPLYAIFISAFLQADTLAELDALESAGFTAGEARRIVEETHDSATVETQSQLWKAASPTVRCMQQHGLLEHAAARESLEMLNLLP